MQIRDRVKELRRVPASALRPNPKNWRTHPKKQQDALRGLLAEVGVANAVLARELPDKSLMLIDGHLRAETLGSELVPVLILDVNEEEADKLLLTLDPLASMAASNNAILKELMDGISTSSEAVHDLLAFVADSNGLLPDLDEAVGAKTDAGEGVPDGDFPAGVRMVQLFLDETNIEEFQQACDDLSKQYGTQNITDTVLEAVRRESHKLQG